MNTAQLTILFQKYLDNTYTEDELELLLLHFHTHEETLLTNLVKTELENEEGRVDASEKDIVSSLAKVHHQLRTYIQQSQPVVKRVASGRIWPRLAVVAASILLVFAISYFFIQHRSERPGTIADLRLHDIKPGTNGAVLTLANGEKITLEQTKAGVFAQQNGSSLNKTGDSLLVYQSGITGNTGELSYNTLETPKGRQYTVILPDGTKVWLNAASYLKYPTSFTGKERLVTLAGEGYFEVVHNSKQPFRVQTAGQLIEDIGTHFNINAYTDEPVIKTTLVEGIVRVSLNGQPDGIALKPGQQAQLGIMDKTIQIRDVNTDASIAWVNGSFVFDSEDLGSILRKISRWYDVDIRFEDPALTNENVTGSISRYSDVSSVLKMLELTGLVHFRIEGRSILVRR